MSPVDVEREATYADVVAAPATLVAELIGGVLHTRPRPTGRHAVAASTLGADLHSPFHRGCGGPGGWWITFEPELHLGRNVLVPDLAGWRRETLPEYPEGAGVTVPPDWVCEVHSASTRRHDRVRKLAVYTEFAVQWLWFVDPEVQTLEAFRRGPDGRWTLLGTWEGDARVRVEPFDALELELGGLWELGAPPEAGAHEGSPVGAAAGLTAPDAAPPAATQPSRSGG